MDRNHVRSRTGAAPYDILDTPIGPLAVGGSVAGVHRIEFLVESGDEQRFIERLARDSGAHPERDDEAAAPWVRELREYFGGSREEFDLPLAPRGTDFQRAVWTRLLAIPFGVTSTYGDIARELGRPAAARAVGAAVGDNPLSVVVPCHRVVGANGSLTGYGWGLERKRWLLELESRPAEKRVA